MLLQAFTFHFWATLGPMLTFFYEHSNLCNINLCNVTHFLITQNPMDRMFVVESYSLLSQVFLPYICGFVIRTTIEVNPYPRIVPCVCTRSVFFFFFLLLLLMPILPLIELLVHGSITLLGKSSGRLTCEDGSCVMVP